MNLEGRQGVWTPLENNKLQKVTPERKGLASWLLFVMFIVILLLSNLVYWDRCGTWLYRYLILAIFLTFLRTMARSRLEKWLDPQIAIETLDPIAVQGRAIQNPWRCIDPRMDPVQRGNICFFYYWPWVWINLHAFYRGPHKPLLESLSRPKGSNSLSRAFLGNL